MSDHNWPAFPYKGQFTVKLPGGGSASGPEQFCGLTKRELFAALAMQGFIAGCYAGNNAGFTVQGNCVAAVEYADALLAELAKERP